MSAISLLNCSYLFSCNIPQKNTLKNLLINVKTIQNLVLFKIFPSLQNTKTVLFFPRAEVMVFYSDSYFELLFQVIMALDT